MYGTQLVLHHADTPGGKSPGVFSITGMGFIQEKVRKLGSWGLGRNSTKLSFRTSPTGPPRTRYGAGRDPWFDRPFDKLTVLSRVEGLTTLSEVDPSPQLRVDAEQRRSIEGESRKPVENQNILDPGPRPAPAGLGRDDELRYSLRWGRARWV